jgi:K319L-like, PKD domain/Kelch motif
MLLKVKYWFTVLLTLSLFIFSCKKEMPCEGCAEKNKQPMAVAGQDQVITLPTDSVSLDGRMSSDPDGTISKWLWTKISGPASFNIFRQSDSLTKVRALVFGTYQFELKVTDNTGLSTKDTVQVIVSSQTTPSNECSINRLLVNAQLVQFGSLSQARFWMGVASAGDKILFGGGYTDDNLTPSSRVDIYDINLQAWSTAELSVARARINAVAVGNKIFFAGGEYYNSSDYSFDNPISVNVMDIYDVSTNTWSVVPLIGGRVYEGSAVAGNQIFFVENGNVDIYDMNTQGWSTKLLSDGRFDPTVVSSNNKVYFAGGINWQVGNIYGPAGMPVSTIDIYDIATNTWSVSTLVVGKVYSAGIAVSNKVFFAGGYNTDINGPPVTTCTVDIIDASAGNSSVQYLSRQWPNPFRVTTKNNKIVFLIGDPNGTNNTEFDIYDITTDAWSIGLLPLQQNTLIWGTSIISVNNSIYVTGVYASGLSNQVWKLEF